MTRGKKILIGVGAATTAFLLLGVGAAMGTEREVVLDTTLEAEIATLTAQAEADADTIASLEADAQTNAEAIAALETAAAEAAASAPDSDLVAAYEADAAAAAETIATLEAEIDALDAATQQAEAATDVEACDPAYPGICLPPADLYDIDLDCGDVDYDFFEVTGDDPYLFDLDGNGLGCERGPDPSEDPNRTNS